MWEHNLMYFEGGFCTVGSPEIWAPQIGISQKFEVILWKQVAFYFPYKSTRENLNASEIWGKFGRFEGQVTSHFRESTVLKY